MELIRRSHVFFVALLDPINGVHLWEKRSKKSKENLTFFLNVMLTLHFSCVR